MWSGLCVRLFFFFHGEKGSGFSMPSETAEISIFKRHNIFNRERERERERERNLLVRFLFFSVGLMIMQASWLGNRHTVKIT